MTAKQHIVIYSDSTQDTPRLHFVLKEIFDKRALNLSYQLTTNLDEINFETTEVIAYTEKEIEGALHIKPHGLLTQTGVEQQDLLVGTWQDLPTLFSQGGGLSFDVFSAIFYSLTRYEEYVAKNRDEGIIFPYRFDFKQSIFHELDVLSKPIVDLWVMELLKLLGANTFGRSSRYRYKPTYDIDSIFKYHGREAWKKYASLITKPSEFSKRAAAADNAKKDPWNVFDWLVAEHQKLDLESIFFIQAGNTTSQDISVPLTDPEAGTVLNMLEKNAEVGLHPSFESSTRDDLVTSQLAALMNVCACPINCSRQHYLNFEFPTTPRMLKDFGISWEHTVGYQNTIGFRAGTAFPFSFFDLEKNETTSLEFMPFSWMDIVTIRDLEMSMDKMFEELRKHVAEIKRVGGTFVSVFHNSSFENDFPQNEYIKFMQIAAGNELG